jgi:aminoglycoside 2'-N-acetyltransferase I
VLSAAEIAAIRGLLWAAFEDDEAFSEDDWQHALGGLHVVLDVAGEVRAHASVVTRELHVDDRPIRTGYVEAVATAPEHQGRGYGTRVMAAVNEHIREEYELGALGTGSPAFYERLGWLRWRGPTAVRTSDGIERTPHEDGGILVLPTVRSLELDLDAEISCDWRPGDVW